MKIEQIYTGCLAQGAYYIESDGEVALRPSRRPRCQKPITFVRRLRSDLSFLIM